MMLYVIVAEPLNNLIKSQQNIKGIVINYNGTSITVQDTQSLESFSHSEYIGLGTGTKVNIKKSEVLCLGKASQTELSFNIPITVNKDCVQILGIYLGPNNELCESMNWKPKVQKIKPLTNLWKERKLILNGKATVWNKLLTSRLWYIINVILVPQCKKFRSCFVILCGTIKYL